MTFAVKVAKEKPALKNLVYFPGEFDIRGGWRDKCGMIRETQTGRDEMRDDTDFVAWHAVQALIEDAKQDLKGGRGEAFAWAVYNAVRRTDADQLENLSGLLRKFGIQVRQVPDDPKRSWILPGGQA